MSSGSSGSFKPLNELHYLFDFLAGGLAGNPTLYVISIDWVGCGACGTPDSPYLAVRDSLPARYRDCDPPPRFGLIDWRLAASFSEPVIQSYKLFLYLTRTKKQLFGGARLVETFTNLDEAAYWRPKFPQLFFIDGRKIDKDTLRSLISDDVFYQFVGSLSDSPLLSHQDQIVDSGNLMASTKRVLSGDLKLDYPNIIDRLSGCIDADVGVLMQLTNFNMYKADGDNPDDFVADAFYKSCDCVIDRFYTNKIESTDCVAFDRRNPCT